MENSRHFKKLMVMTGQVVIIYKKQVSQNNCLLTRDLLLSGLTSTLPHVKPCIPGKVTSRSK